MFINASQLPLPISLPDNETFASFYAGSNQLLVDTLQTVLAQPNFYSIYFWSTMSLGRTHLLYASCHALLKNNKKACYIPLEQSAFFTPDIFIGLDDYDLVCLDNIDFIAGNLQWEVAIFDLYNRLTEQKKAKLFITANSSPNQLNLSLPDLRSRLNWGQVYQLKELYDDDKLKALQLRSHLRGFELPTEVGLFLLKRVNRDMPSLFNLLDKLDQATITEQRKITIPFIKQLFDL